MTELVRHRDVATILCPDCGATAPRAIGAPSMILGPTLHPALQMDARWQDAKSRADLGFAQIRS